MKLSHTTTPHVRFEDLVRIEKITHDQIEAGEVIGQFSRKLRLLAKKLASGPYSIERVACA